MLERLGPPFPPDQIQPSSLQFKILKRKRGDKNGQKMYEYVEDSEGTQSCLSQARVFYPIFFVSRLN